MVKQSFYNKNRVLQEKFGENSYGDDFVETCK